MGWIGGPDGQPPDNIDWCDKCSLSHYTDRKYWIWNGTKYSEEQFEKALNLKAFW